VKRLQLLLPHFEWRRLRRRAYSAQQTGCFEVCGVFGATRDRQIALIFLKNAGARPGHFDINLCEFRQARTQLRLFGVRYMGIFHSHPISEAKPGPGDIRGAPKNSFMLIYDVCGTDARLWKLVVRQRRKTPVEIPIRIERSFRKRHQVTALRAEHSPPSLL
jgi:proteasome lid subunit RPN8/RPN11